LESSWRLNVWEYGLTPCGDIVLWTLAARLHDSPDVIITNSRQPSTYPNVTAYALPGVVVPDAYFPIPIVPGTLHFPYGVAVEPDVHG